ncbi:MAG: cell division protein ZapE [Glutamicibacter ardleyensis]
MPSPLLPSGLLRARGAAKRRRRVVSHLQGQGLILDDRQNDLIGLLTRNLAHLSEQEQRGTYIYGPPGRGKSMLIDAICADLDQKSTARFHFHEFFQTINNPSKRRSDQSSGSVFTEGLQRELQGLKVLFFDEFHCVEPGDAMFMAKMVNYCEEAGIFIITTSNYAPEKLLDDEYFHHLIEPTIAKIRSSFEVFELDAAVDYRMLETPEQMRLSGYRSGTLNPGYSPIDETDFTEQLPVGYDHIGPVRLTGTSIEISFSQLCRTRRNTADYLELASRFNCWHITSVPSSEHMPMDEERRFANLIDVFYDKDIEIHLYTQDRLEFLGHQLHGTERARLKSRLAQLANTLNTTDRIMK